MSYLFSTELQVSPLTSLSLHLSPSPLPPTEPIVQIWAVTFSLTWSNHISLTTKELMSLDLALQTFLAALGTSPATSLFTIHCRALNSMVQWTWGEKKTFQVHQPVIRCSISLVMIVGHKPQTTVELTLPVTWSPLGAIAIFISHYNCCRIFKYSLGSLLLWNYNSC